VFQDTKDPSTRRHKKITDAGRIEPYGVRYVETMFVEMLTSAASSLSVITAVALLTATIF